MVFYFCILKGGQFKRNSRNICEGIVCEKETKMFKTKVFFFPIEEFLFFLLNGTHRVLREIWIRNLSARIKTDSTRVHHRWELNVAALKRVRASFARYRLTMT